MTPTLRSVAALVLGATLLVAGNGLLGTLVSLRLAASDVGPTGLGLVLSSYFAGLVVGAALTERLIRNVGHIRAFAALAGVVCACTLGLGLTFGVAPWLAARFTAGLCLAGLYTAVESWLNDRATVATRGTILAVYMTATQVALASGQLLVGRFDAADLRGYVAAGLLQALALVPVALTQTPQPVLGPRRTVGVRVLLGRVPLAMVGAAVAGAVQGIALGLGPIFAVATRTPASRVGHFMAALVLGGLVVQAPLGWLSDRVDRRVVLSAASAGCVGAAALLGWLAWSNAREPSLVAGAAILGAFAFCLYPLSLAHANDYLDDDERVPASVTLVATYGLGAALGPAVASEVGRGLGALAFPTAIASVALVPTVYALWRVGRRAAAAPAARAAYVPTALPQIAPGASDLTYRPSARPPPPGEPTSTEPRHSSTGTNRPGT